MSRELYVISDDVKNVLFGTQEMPGGDRAGTIKVIRNRPPLGNVAGRVPLLRRLLSTDLSRECVAPTRYVLHGWASGFDDDCSLLTKGADANSLWARIVGEGLKCQQAEWRMLAKEVTDRLNPTEMEMLGISHPTRSEAMELIKVAGPESFAWQLLLDCFADPLELPPDIVEAFATSAWLPMKAGRRRVRPCDVIRLSGLEDDVVNQRAPAAD